MIGNNVLIKYSIIGNNVRILDGSIIGKKVLVFPNIKNIRYPHVGIVIIEENAEIGCNNTIDRGFYQIQSLERILLLIIKFILHIMLI